MLLIILFSTLLVLASPSLSYQQHRRHQFHHHKSSSASPHNNLDRVLNRLDQLDAHQQQPQHRLALKALTQPAAPGATATDDVRSNPARRQNKQQQVGESGESGEDVDSDEDLPDIDDRFRMQVHHKSSNNGVLVDDLYERPSSQRDEAAVSPYSYSQFKWQVMSNRQRMDQHRQNMLHSRTQHVQPTSTFHSSTSRQQQAPPQSVQADQNSTTEVNEQSIREAIQHALRVSKEATCKVPRPKVIQVKDYYPHPSKTYIPHCAIIYQCGDDTGCCRHETLTCGPKSAEKVQFYFYTTTLANPRGNTVEKLSFYNHTECECVDKLEDLMPRDHSGPGSFTALRLGETPANRHHGFTSFDRRLARVQHPNQEERSCRCPRDFSLRTTQSHHQQQHHVGGTSSSCVCDCFEKDKACIRLKRGRDYFSVQDRWCIQMNRCSLPTCEYGTFIDKAGRCPRKKERFNSWQRHGSHHAVSTSTTVPPVDSSENY